MDVSGMILRLEAHADIRGLTTTGDQHWYFGAAYVGNPSEPYGGGVDASVNQEMGFYMTEASLFFLLLCSSVQRD